mgnify:FL=1|tara:strand:+ start:102 stop:617 length:516 start_codon:yes stop_codon:yes gene_type:complete
MEFENLDNALLDFGTRVVDEMQNQLFENNSVGTGDLARSITRTVVPLPNNGGEQLQVSLLWYGQLLEDGGPERKAGRMPPVRSIEGWIKTKKIPVPAAFKSPENFAWAIAKSIAKKGPSQKFGGYPKKPFIEESIANAAANFGTAEITAALEKDIIINLNDAATSAGGTIS